MTTIVAIRKNGSTCIVSDSLVTYGKRRKESYGELLVPTPKLSLCKNAIVGFSGSVAWDHGIKEILSSSEYDIGSCSPYILQKLFSDFWQLFLNKYEIAQVSKERFTSFSKCQMVIARPDSLFEITVEGCVIENKDSIVIGNGAPFSYGAIKALEPLMQDSLELAMAGIKAAAAWDPNTLGPFCGWHISERGEFSEFMETV